MPHTEAWTLSSPRGEDAGPRLRNAVLGRGHAVRAGAQGFRIHVGRGSARLTREVEPGDARTKLPRGVWGTGGDGPRKQQNGGQGAGGYQGLNLRPEDRRQKWRRGSVGPARETRGQEDQHSGETDAQRTAARRPARSRRGTGRGAPQRERVHVTGSATETATGMRSLGCGRREERGRANHPLPKPGQESGQAEAGVPTGEERPDRQAERGQFFLPRTSEEGCSPRAEAHTSLLTIAPTWACAAPHLCAPVTVRAPPSAVRGGEVHPL